MTITLPQDVVYALWACLILYLTVMARQAKRDTQRHLLQRLILLLAMIVAFLLPHLPVFRFLAKDAIGPVFFVWARQCLGRNWSQTVSAKEGQALVTTGPYRYIRHPMYAAGLVMCLGSAFVVAGGFVFLLLLLTPLFLWRAGAEDRLLARLFPREFPDYRKRTKALIPFVW
jgi:protein-S-isoprenylcysteine O-methyltransferase